MARTMPVVAVVVGVVVGVLTRLHGQTAGAPTERLAFDVASVKRAAPADGIGGGGYLGETFSVRHITTRRLLAHALGLRYRMTEIVGGPAWLDTEQFEVIGKTKGPSNRVNQMLQTLLAERFGLRWHVESRDVPVYFLDYARQDHRLGPGLVPTKVDCLARQPGGDAPCRFQPTTNSITGTGMMLEMVSANAPVGRRVIDRTGLAGQFNVDLHWQPDELQERIPVEGRSLAGAPSFFVAVQEQLGLKLEAGRAMVPHVVIDAAERPSPD